MERSTGRLSLPDDSNHWQRWMTAQQQGDYRIVATLTVKKTLKKTHEKIVGEIAGRISR